jgi:multicomponent Na+:H+ antiporter subunit C
MSSILLFGLTGAGLIALGVYGLLATRNLLQRVIGFNLAGSGLFLMLGALARRGSGAAADPVPQALIITGIVVAFSATALALALIARLGALTGRARLPEEGGREAEE